MEKRGDLSVTVVIEAVQIIESIVVNIAGDRFCILPFPPDFRT